MNNLYFVGGSVRTGKSTIVERFAADKSVAIISADAVQEGLRSVLIDEPFQMLQEIHLEGWADLKKPGSLERKSFQKQAHEHDLARQAIAGMLDHYQRNKSDVIVEGSIITPDWVASLKLGGFSIHAVFVGFSDDKYADSIIEHAKNNPHDWINEWLNNEQGDETSLRKWISEQAISNRELEKSAKACGYTYFDVSSQPFNSYLRAVHGYLNS